MSRPHPTQLLPKSCEEEQREADEERFGPATIETMDLVKTFCGMHLVVNLRKAFLNGINDEEEDSTRYNKVDTLVHDLQAVWHHWCTRVLPGSSVIS